MQIEGIGTDDIHAGIDQRGFSILTIDRVTSSMLARAFEADIQTAATAGLVYEYLEDITQGRVTKRSFSGNSCTILMSYDLVRIENDVLEGQESFEMSPSQYRTILDVWSALLRDS